MRLRTGFMVAALVGMGTSLGVGADNVLTGAEKQAGWSLMFNGKDLTGWEARDGKWKVEDGALVGREGWGFLAFTGGKFDQYGDVEFSADIKVYDTGENPKAKHMHRGNSGFYFHTPVTKEKPAGGMMGYEAQVDHGDKNNPTGSIYGYPKGRDPQIKDGEWFNMRVKAEGWHFQIWVNGEKTLDMTEKSHKFGKGYFRLQVHHPSDVVVFKNVKVRELGSASAAKGEDSGVLSYTMKNIDGEDVALADYKGKVLMVVNVASKCGLTPQYTDLQKLYEKYNAKGFEILAFPANNFGAQEPGTEAEIKKFCSTKYSVSFPMFSKVSVKGGDKCELYQFLTDKKRNPHTEGVIRWNFEKFVVGRNGEVVADFHPRTTPFDEKLVSTIESELAKK